jgi:hypothetical protein
MATQEELLLEAESRGLLDADKQAALDELRTRGGIMSKADYEVRTGKNTPDYRPKGGGAGLPASVQRVSDMLTDPIGVQDEIVGAGQFVRKLVTTGSMDEAGKAYTEAAERIRAERRVAREDTGAAGMAAEIVGGGALMGPGRAIAAVAPRVSRVLQTARAGAGFGAASGAAQGEGGVVNRGLSAGTGAAVGAVVGPALSEVAIPAVMRTVQGVREAVRYGNRAIRSARNPEQAAVENVADRGVAAGIDWDAARAQVSPATSANLAGRGITEENIADIVSRGLRGESPSAIGADYGITGPTVSRYVNAYRDANPTPMNLMDIAKEQLGDGAAAPVTRLGRAAYSLAGDESGEAAQRLVGRQETQGGRVSNIIDRSVTGGDFEATRAAGLQNLQDEARTAYRQFYDEPELAIDELGDLMADPLFRRATTQAQRQARVETIRRNQEARRAGRPEEPVPDVDPGNQVFSPEMLDNIQRQLRIASEGHASNPNNARHARNLREVFLDRIEDHYPSFSGIRRNYATGMGEFGEEGALEAGAALTAKLGAPSREALRGFNQMTEAQQELFRLGFARKLMDDAANKQTGAAVANQFNTQAVRDIVERLYPRSNRALHQQGQRLIRDLRREATTTRTKNDVMAGARTAELGSDMGRMMEGAQAAADVATGQFGRLLSNLSTRLSSQIGRRGAREVLDVLTETDPARLLPMLNRLSRAAQSTRERQAYVMAIREVRSIGVRRLSGIIGQEAGGAMAITDQRGSGR